MSRVVDRLPAAPAVVDEVTVRLVAAGVFAAGLTAVLTQQWWLYAVLAADFLLRAAGGPHRSFLARAVQAGVRPRLAVTPRPTAFAPKRFAAGIGAVMTTLAVLLSVLGVAAGPLLAPTPVTVVGLLLVVFSGLEAAFGFCVGCRLFALLARARVVREDVCVDCVRPASGDSGFGSSDLEDDADVHRAR